MSNSFFSGAHGGLPDKISAESHLECKICWYEYDPELGDAEAQIPVGTAFSALPDHWRCPVCDSSKLDFLLIGA